MRKLLEELKGKSIDGNLLIPECIFHLQRVTIPLFNEKMLLFRTLSSISFDSHSYSLLQSAELIFTALNKFRVVSFSVSDSQNVCASQLNYSCEGKPITYVPTRRGLSLSQRNLELHKEVDETCLSSSYCLMQFYN